MDLKKSIFSYIVWAAFAVLCCFLLVSVLEAAGIREMLGWSLTGMTGAACGYLLSASAVFMALRTICTEIKRHIKNKAKMETVCSVALPALILSGAVAYLVLYLVYHTPLTLEDDSFYRQAMVSGISDNRSIPFTVHGASWFYICLLRVMLLIFGNTPFAGVVLQIILFFICLLLLYVGMQAFAGVFPAAVSMAVFAFLPVSLKYVFSLTPEFFYLALYLSGFCLTGTLCRRFRQQKTASLAYYLSGFFLGIYIGFLVYLDIFSISLYFFMAVLASMGKEKIKQGIRVGFVSVLGGACGFFLSVLGVFLAGKMIFSEYLQEFTALCFRNAGFQAEILRQGLWMPDVTLAGSILAVSFAFFVIPAFFVWKRCQNSAFIINLFLVYGLSVFSVFSMAEQVMVTFAWSLLAGLGLYGTVRQPERSERSGTKEPGETEDNGHKEEEKAISKIKKKKKVRENAPEKDKMLKKIIDSVKSAEEELENLKVSDTAEKTVSEKPAEKRKEQEKPAPGTPLHNPLPVPKKKKRPVADFEYQVEETKMKFDIDVADGDDFDW